MNFGVWCLIVLAVFVGCLITDIFLGFIKYLLQKKLEKDVYSNLQ